MTELPTPDNNAKATICQYEVANPIADTDKAIVRVPPTRNGRAP